MKRIFLLIILPSLLIALAFAQTPAASGNTDQINVKGCLGGSEGNYTLAENNTGKIFKITTSRADLKAYVGQDVNVIGQKAETAENSLAVTELNMIYEHCTAAASAPAASVSAPAETVGTPVVAAAAPAASAPAATISAPSETVNAPPAAAPPAVAPDATVSTPAKTVSAPPAIAAAPQATVSAPAETVSGVAGRRTRPSAQPKKSAETPAAAAAPAEPVSTPVADAAVPTAPAGPPPQTVSTPAATRASTGRSAGMLVAIVVVVLLIGAGVPLYNRWRKRKLLEETRGQNLSFTKEVKSDPGKSDTTGGRKAA